MYLQYKLTCTINGIIVNVVMKQRLSGWTLLMADQVPIFTRAYSTLMYMNVHPTPYSYYRVCHMSCAFLPGGSLILNITA